MHPKSDVYGLGAVLYAMLTGTPPYAGDVPSLVLARVLTESPPDLAAVRPDLPGGLVAICQRAMARDAGRRYASAAEMAEDLDRFLEGRPAAVQARAPLRPSQPKRGIVLAVVATLALGAFLTAGLVLEQRLRTRAPAATSSPARLELVLAGPGRKTSPSFSPDGKRLAYASNAEGRFNIY